MATSLPTRIGFRHSKFLITWIRNNCISSGKNIHAYNLKIPYVYFLRNSSIVPSSDNSLHPFTDQRLSKTSTSNYLVQKLNDVLKVYEDFIGITEIKIAQQRVIEAERNFIEAQELRRIKNGEIQHIQFRLKEIHSEMDRVSRGEDRFYELFNKEHAIVKEEKRLLQETNNLERDERKQFQLLSAGIREAHELERIHSEKTKYWPILGSFITFILASIYGLYRLQKLQAIMSESGGSDVLHSAFGDLQDTLEQQHNQLQSFVADIKGLLNRKQTSPHIIDFGLWRQQATRDTDADVTVQLINEVKKQEESLMADMRDVKRMIAAGTAADPKGGAVVYVGPEVKDLLDDAQHRLELKIKANALATVASVYAGLAVAIPLLIAFFKNSGN